MDVIQKLHQALDGLPLGEYTNGLKAVARHIEAAVGHFERANQSNEDEAFTDCIYRTNQAFEGSLKEAFRTISGKDPAKMRLFDVEKFFESAQSVRPRVLRQIQRYREDYRNPSTHDYRLDFDEDEALLAILAVSAFAKSLITQIRNQVEVDAVKESPNLVADENLVGAAGSLQEFAAKLANSLRDFLNDSKEVSQLPSRETSALVSAFLEKSGLSLTREFYLSTADHWFEWDLLAEDTEKHIVPIEIKTSRGRWSRLIAESRLSEVMESAQVGKYPFAILVEGAGWGTEHTLEEYTNGDSSVFRIGRPITKEYEEVNTDNELITAE